MRVVDSLGRLPPNTRMQSDRFAREIVPFLMPSLAARSRRLMRHSLGPGQTLFLPIQAPTQLLNSCCSITDLLLSIIASHEPIHLGQQTIGAACQSPRLDQSHANSATHDLIACSSDQPSGSFDVQSSLLNLSVPESQIIAVIEEWHDQGYRDDDVLKSRTPTARSLRKKRTIKLLLGAKLLHSNIAGSWSYQNTQLKQQVDEEFFG